MDWNMLYWGCLWGGVAFAIVSVVLGEVVGQWFEALDFSFGDGPSVLQPMTLVGGITIFGGVGILLLDFTDFAHGWVLFLTVISALLASTLIYFFYIVPMDQAENSTGFAMTELEGMIGEVMTAIPATGYGEVLVKIGAGNTNQIAASFDRSPIPSGEKVVIVEVKEHTLYVTPYRTLE